MKKVFVIAVIALLCGCCNCSKRNKTIHAAGFDIEKGQQIRSFFDDYHEPMHARYIGHDTIKWTYYVDYAPDEGKIVRYCELDNYKRGELCKLNVEFYNKHVSDAYSDCN